MMKFEERVQEWLEKAEEYVGIDPFEVIKYTSKIIYHREKNEPYLKALVHRAGAWYHIDVFEYALRDINKIIELDPKPKYFGWRAELNYELGMYQEALADYAIDIASPEDDGAEANSRVERAEVYEKVGEFAKAINDLTLARVIYARESDSEQTLLCDEKIQQLNVEIFSQCASPKKVDT